MQGGLADFVESRFAAGAKGGMHGAMADLLLLAHALSMDDSGAALRESGFARLAERGCTNDVQMGMVSKVHLQHRTGPGVSPLVAWSHSAGWWKLTLT